VLSKIKRIAVIVWAIAASLAVVALLFLRRSVGSVQKNIEGDAQNAKEKTNEAVKETAASDLVAGAANADELRIERESIIERFRCEVRNRLGEKLHGPGSPGTD